jgi:hypothetical protein
MIEQRVKVTLRDEALETLQLIADQRGTTIGQVLRQAIGHEKFLWEEIRAGNRIVIEGKDGWDRRELVIT